MKMNLYRCLEEMRDALYTGGIDDDGRVILPALVPGDVVQNYMGRFVELLNQKEGDNQGHQVSRL